MPVGKDIYKQMGKFGERKKRAQEKSVERKGPEVPQKVHQFTKNKVTRSRSNNVHIVDLAGPRSIAPTEGMPAVNSKSGKELVEKAVHKVKPKQKEVDPSAGVIEPNSTKTKKCSVCRESGHTKRNCPSL